MKKWMVYFICSSLMFTHTATAGLAINPDGAVQYKAVAKQIDSYVTLLREIKGHIDPAQFDLAAKLDQLAYDEKKIVAWVKDEVRYELYQGLLRGAHGTLIGKAGNSLDQSILLTTLLKDAGLDARIVRITLNNSDAQFLIKQMLAEPAIEEPVGNLSEMETLLASFSRDNISDPSVLASIQKNLAVGKSGIREKLYTDVRKESTFIAEQLGDNGLESPKGTEIDFTEEAKNYFAVEYKVDSAAGDWALVHPALGSDRAFSGPLKISSYMTDHIPSELQHRIRFEAFAYQDVGSKRIEKVLIPPWERPAANLQGMSISFGASSARLTQAVNEWNSTTLQEEPENDVFVPHFNGAPGPNSFDLLGNVVPTAEASSMFAGVFATVSKTLNKAAGAIIGFDSKEKPQMATKLAAIKMRYTSISPSGVETAYWRTFYDVDFESSGSDYQARLAKLTSTYSFAVSTGKRNSAVLLNQYLDYLINTEVQMKLLASIRYGSKTNFDNLVASATSTNVAWPLHDLQQRIFGAYFDALPHTHGYLGAPAITVHYKDLPFISMSREGFDIVTLPFRAVDLQQWSYEPQEVMKAGIWATFTEASLISNGDGELFNLQSVFESFRQKEKEFVTLTGASGAKTLDDLPLDTEAKSHLRRDIKNGYSLVLAPDTSDSVAWWRVNTQTGDTLGIMKNGEGGVQYVSELELQMLGKALAVAAAGFVIYFTTYLFCQVFGNPAKGDGKKDAEKCHKVSQGVTSGILAIYALTRLAATAIIGAIFAFGNLVSILQAEIKD